MTDFFTIKGNYQESFNAIIEFIEQYKITDNGKEILTILNSLQTADRELENTFTEILQQETTIVQEINELVFQLIRLQQKIILLKCKDILSTPKDSPIPRSYIKDLVLKLTAKISAMNDLIDSKNIIS